MASTVFAATEGVGLCRVTQHSAAETQHLLQRVALQGFLETFGNNYPQADVDDYVAQRLSLAAIESELLDTTNYFYLIQVSAGDSNTALETVGYIKFQVPSVMYHQHLPNELLAQYPKPACLERLYILQPWQKQGWAAMALQFAIGQLRGIHGAQWLYLSVWSENYKAQRFYQRAGFNTVGSFLYPVGQSNDVELLYGLPL